MSRGRIVDLDRLPENRMFSSGPDEKSVAQQSGEAALTPVSSTEIAAQDIRPDTEGDHQQIAEQDQFGDNLPVASVKKTPMGNLIVEMTNGQHWRQLNSDNTRVILPKNTSNLNAEIRRGFLGSVTLEIDGTRRSFKVSRIK